MAEVMSFIPEENAPGELNADEQESLAVGEELEAQHEGMLAGKYKNAQDLEAAYLELQKKLGSEGESEVEYEDTEEEEADQADELSNDLYERLWESSQNEEFSDELLIEISEADPADLAEMYLDYRRQVEENAGPQMTQEDADALKEFAGGEEQYGELLGWAKQNFSEQEIDMYDAVMESGNPQAAFFAIQALALRYQDSMGYEGDLIQGKASDDSNKGFRSQAELVQAMNDPRYEKDTAYREDVMRKLANSNIDF